MPEVFISYSRKDKDFVRRLHTALEADGRDAWVDWENIPLTADWLEEIYAGIEAANAFAFVISSASVRSEVCSLELMHAIEHNKRIVPILRHELLNEQEQAALHPTISSHNWIFFVDDDDFHNAFQSLVDALDTDLEHLQVHTRLLVRAVEWDEKDRDTSFLLRGNDLKEAERWFSDSADKQPNPTELQLEYITASSKSAAARRRVVIITGIYVVIVAALAIFAFSQAVSAENRRQEAEDQRNIAENNEATAVSAQSTALHNEEQANSLALASNAQQALYRDHNPELAIALALEANNVEQPSALARSVLAQAAYFPGVRSIKEGFSEHFSQVAISPDDTMAISISAEDDLVLWELETGEEIHHWEFEEEVWALAFSPDGSAIAAGIGSSSGSLVVSDVESKEELARENIGWLNDLTFTSDSRQVLIGADEGLFLFDIEGGEVVRQFMGHEDVVWSVAVSLDGILAASGSEDGTVRTWNLETGEQISMFNPDAGQAYTVAISPDGSRLLAGFYDGSLYLWDVDTEEEIHRLTGHSLRVWDVVFGPDGMTAVSASQDTTMIHWNLETAEPVRRYYGHTTRIYGVDMTSDARHILSGSWDGTVRLWDVRHGAELQRLEGHDSRVWGVDFYTDSGDGALRAISVGGDGTLIQWNLETGEIIDLLGEGEELPTQYGVAVSPDGRRAISASRDMTLNLWDLVSGERIRVFQGHIDRVLGVALSPDGRTALSASRSDDATLILWDVETGVPIRRYKGHQSRVWDVAFSPDGRIALSGSTDDDEIILWDVETGEILRRIGDHDGVVYSVAVSPDGRLALSGSEDRTMRLWNLETGAQVGRFDGHTADVLSVAFSPDGRLAVSGSVDDSVRVWDVSTGAEILRLEGHTGDVWSVAFSPNGQAVLSGARDNIVRYWRIESLDELIRWTYENRYVPQLTCEQRELYRVEPFCDETGIAPTATPYQPRQQTVVPTVTPEVVRLTITPMPSMTPSVTPTPIPALAVVGENQGTVAVNDYDVWQYNGSAGEVLTISVNADFPANDASPEEQRNQGLMDSILVVIAPDGSVLESNDDFQLDFTDSVIEELELPDDGIYLIEVRTGERDTGGVYTLVIEPVESDGSDSGD